MIKNLFPMILQSFNYTVSEKTSLGVIQGNSECYTKVKFCSNFLKYATAF